MAKPTEPPDLSTFGGRVRSIRERLKLTQKRLGELVGRDSQIVSKWERGDHEPDDRAIVTEIARLGEVSLAWLLTGETSASAESYVDTTDADEIPPTYSQLIDEVVKQKKLSASVGDRLRKMFRYTGVMSRFELEANADIVARAASKAPDRAQTVVVEPRPGTMKL